MNGNEPPNKRRRGTEPPVPPAGARPHMIPRLTPDGPAARGRHEAPPQRDARPQQPGPRQHPPHGPGPHRRPVAPPPAAPIPQLDPQDRQPARRGPHHQPGPPQSGHRQPDPHAPTVVGGRPAEDSPALAYSKTPGGHGHQPPHPAQPPQQGRPGSPAPGHLDPVRVPPQRHNYQQAPAGPPQHGAPFPPSAPRSRNPFRRRSGRRLRLGRIALMVVIALLVTTIGSLFYYDSKLHRVDALASYAGRPGPTPGSTWLIVGTDSREGLSQADKDRLATGDSDGSRTDTIMLVHKPPSGKSMIISIPRDLYVDIPGNGQRKINAAFNFGGPKLLVQTVEQLTKMRIDHYGEIGFGGFADLVDAVGGVNICIDTNLRDPKAGLRLKKGCHDLNGKQALGLVRTRAFPNADLERVVNQRKFLGALMAKATSPGVVLNPFRLVPFVNGAVGSLTVDKKDHIWNLVSLAMALRGKPITTTTPNAGSQVTDDGDSLIVGSNTEEFFTYLRKGKPVPDELIQNSGGAIK